MSSGTTAWQFRFDLPTNDFADGTDPHEIHVKGGYAEGDTYIDDPYPVAGRGMWFDGYLDHFELKNLTVAP